MSRCRYLVFVRCGDCGSEAATPRVHRHTHQTPRQSCPHWRGATIEVRASAETLISLSHIHVAGLFLVVAQSTHLQQVRTDFTRKLDDVIRLVNEQTSCHEAIAESMHDLRQSAMELRKNIVSAIQQVEESFNTQSIADVDELEVISIEKLYRETLHQCYQFAFDVRTSISHLLTSFPCFFIVNSLCGFFFSTIVTSRVSSRVTCTNNWQKRSWISRING